MAVHVGLNKVVFPLIQKLPTDYKLKLAFARLRDVGAHQHVL